MNYVSTRNKSKTFKFKDVFLKGLADDGGLFVPEDEFNFDSEKLNSLKDLDYNELAKEIISPFVDDFINDDDLSKIIKKSYSSFRKKNVIDLLKVEDRFILELFHGPTLAFKDVAMQLLGNFYLFERRSKSPTKLPSARLVINLVRLLSYALIVMFPRCDGIERVTILLPYLQRLWQQQY